MQSDASLAGGFGESGEGVEVWVERWGVDPWFKEGQGPPCNLSNLLLCLATQEVEGWSTAVVY
jgi:hypothetical protein